MAGLKSGRSTRLVAVLAGAALFAWGDAFAEVRAGAWLVYYTWREYSAVSGSTLLEETGIRAAATLDFSREVSRNTELRASGKVYGGDVHYDGQYQDGTPATATTRYIGAAVEAGVGYRPDGFNRDGLTMIAMLGGDNWIRDIGGTGGYQELYRVLFLRLGAEHDYKGWQTRGGLLLPLKVEEEVNLFDGLDLEPDPEPWFYLGVGYKLNERVQLGVDYYGYRFDVSDAAGPLTSGGVPVDLDGDGRVPDYAVQPRSEQDIIAVTLRMLF